MNSVKYNFIILKNEIEFYVPLHEGTGGGSKLSKSSLHIINECPLMHSNVAFKVDFISKILSVSLFFNSIVSNFNVSISFHACQIRLMRFYRQTFCSISLINYLLLSLLFYLTLYFLVIPYCRRKETKKKIPGVE